MIRIQLSSTAGGSPVNYTCRINPLVYDAADEPRLNKLEVLHGANVWQEEPNDYYTRIMRWENILPTETGFMSMLNYFRSIEGKNYYINFNDLEVFNKRWVDYDTSTPWRKCRIINTKSEVRPGGRLIFDYFEVHIKPED